MRLGYLCMENSFWLGKKVLLTGHTGFKGSWMTLLLNELGAEVFGFSDHSIKPPSMFDDLNLQNICARSEFGDIRELAPIQSFISENKPEVVIHMAAQSIVAEGYVDPVKTFSTNVIGTLNLLEAVRNSGAPIRTVICVTSDKSYENVEKGLSFVESDPLGGIDPYSASKSASEMVVNSYRASFMDKINIPLCTARAGNVIGGGDWSKDRLVPDAFRSIIGSKSLEIRNPQGIRPWQHVLEPNLGYLMLARKSFIEGVGGFSSAWNFGPPASGNLSVSDLLQLIKREIPDFKWHTQAGTTYREAKSLMLSSAKAKTYLDWETRLSIEETISLTVDWYLANRENLDMNSFSRNQIRDYLSLRMRA
jgi:CDP-glucose 4,6-dehydratase